MNAAIIHDDVIEKSCRKCHLLLPVECFPRLEYKSDWLGENRRYILRENNCSECKSKLCIKKFKSIPLEQKLKPHLHRCYRRSRKRFFGSSNNTAVLDEEEETQQDDNGPFDSGDSNDTTSCREGITIEHLVDQYKIQEGKCFQCNKKMDFHTRGMGWNLCLEDREFLNVWPSSDNLITVDRVDASHFTLPYFDLKTKTKNFNFLCFGCNRDKYFEEDASEKLSTRNSILQKENQQLKSMLEQIILNNNTNLNNQIQEQYWKQQNDMLLKRIEILKLNSKHNTSPSYPTQTISIKPSSSTLKTTLSTTTTTTTTTTTIVEEDDEEKSKPIKKRRRKSTSSKLPCISIFTNKSCS